MRWWGAGFMPVSLLADDSLSKTLMDKSRMRPFISYMTTLHWFLVWRYNNSPCHWSLTRLLTWSFGHYTSNAFDCLPVSILLKTGQSGSELRHHNKRFFHYARPLLRTHQRDLQVLPWLHTESICLPIYMLLVGEQVVLEENKME